MSALPSHSPQPANSAARGGGTTATGGSEGIAGNITQGAERLDAQSEGLAHSGPSALSALTTPSISDDAHDGIAARTAGGETITIQDLTLNEIHINLRHRQGMGDRQGLADSVDMNGLLQPIGVTAAFVLMFGERRGRPAEEKMARRPQFFAKTFPHPLLLKDIKVLATDPLHQIAGRTRPDRRRPRESCPRSSHGTEQEVEQARLLFHPREKGRFRANTQQYAQLRSTTLS